MQKVPGLEDYIQVDVVPVRRAFEFGRTLYLPSAQRAFAWPEQSVQRLLSDLLQAAASADRRYFLGRLCLAGSSDEDCRAIIDGQQRLVTLSILFALLAEVTQDKDLAAQLRRLIWREPSAASNADVDLTEEGLTPRIEVQASIRQLYARLLTKPSVTFDPPGDVSGSAASDPGLERGGACSVGGGLNGVETQLFTCAAALTSRLAEAQLDAASLDNFISFLLDRCLIIVELVGSTTEAWQILATTEETSHPFHATERAKLTLLASLPVEQQAQAAALWDATQARLGNAQLGRLLEHVRVISVGARWRGKSNIPVETELVTLFGQKPRTARAFSRRLAGYGELLEHMMRRAALQNISGDDPVGAKLYRLGWLDTDTWIAPTLAHLERTGLDGPATEIFLAGLERLAWLFKLAGTDPVKRDRVFAELCEEISRQSDPQRLAGLAVPPDVLDRALLNLRSRTFYYKPFAFLVLRRLSVLLGQDPGPRSDRGVTGEHVLPRNPRPGSGWLEDFGDRSGVASYADRLGNCALLNFANNQAAANAEWPAKSEILAQSEFVLANEAATWPAWTPATITLRTEKLIALITTDWELPPSRTMEAPLAPSG